MLDSFSKEKYDWYGSRFITFSQFCKKITQMKIFKSFARKEKYRNIFLKNLLREIQKDDRKKNIAKYAENPLFSVVNTDYLKSLNKMSKYVLWWPFPSIKHGTTDGLIQHPGENNCFLH